MRTSNRGTQIPQSYSWNFIQRFSLFYGRIWSVSWNKGLIISSSGITTASRSFSSSIEHSIKGKKWKRLKN